MAAAQFCKECLGSLSSRQTALTEAGQGFPRGSTADRVLLVTHASQNLPFSGRARPSCRKSPSGSSTAPDLHHKRNTSKHAGIHNGVQQQGGD